MEIFSTISHDILFFKSFYLFRIALFTRCTFFSCNKHSFAGHLWLQFACLCDAEKNI
eukprot:m.253882 g.253882  ORF g.253882 m.253882 type:complete len:57 (+) comp17501_c0_seq1:991-1161(+)